MNPPLPPLPPAAPVPGAPLVPLAPLPNAARPKMSRKGENGAAPTSVMAAAFAASVRRYEAALAARLPVNWAWNAAPFAASA